MLVCKSDKTWMLFPWNVTFPTVELQNLKTIGTTILVEIVFEKSLEWRPNNQKYSLPVWNFSYGSLSTKKVETVETVFDRVIDI